MPPTSRSGPGPFKYGAGKGSEQTLQWNRRNGWWATKAFGMRMPMQYIVDIHNSSNTSSMQNFLQNNIDLSNNFFPGIDKQVGGKVGTYYPKAPYMLSANTAWLMPNTTHKPLNDRAFRRALAMSINVDQIVSDDYGNIVTKANPTGLLPTWNKWIDTAQVKKLGFKLQRRGREGTARVERLPGRERGRLRREQGRVVDQPEADRPERMVGLDDRDPDHRGEREARRHQDHPGVPYLPRARQRARCGYVRPRHQQRQADQQHAVHLLRPTLPPADRRSADFANFSRFTQAGAAPWALTLKLNKMRSTNVAKVKKINSQIQKYILEDLPAIPLWYNGTWAQWNTTYWTNFPSSAVKTRQSVPVMWNGYLNMTGIETLANLKKK